MKGNLLPDSTTSRISLTLDSTIASVDKIEQTAEEFARRAGFDEDTASNIAMAVREAGVNAVLHGNAHTIPPSRSPPPSSPPRTRSSSESPTRAPASILTRFPTRLPRKTSFEAPVAESFLSVHSWMRYTFASYIPALNLL